MNEVSGALRRYVVPAVIGLLFVAGGLGVLAGMNIAFAVLAVIALACAVALILNPMVGIAALILSLVAGQLVRIPAFGSEGAILPNDLLLPALAAAWLLRGMFMRQVQFPTSPLSWPIVTMLVVFVLTFIAGVSQLPFLDGHERLVSMLYIVRWLEYALLIFIVADIVVTARHARQIIYWLFLAAAALVVLGFAQLRIFPDFRFMVPEGWDPHIGRLLSTWFDPNFIGGFFSFVALIAGALALHLSGKLRIALWTLAALLFTGMVLTFSRSGYAAFIAGAVVLTILTSRRLFLLLVVIAGLVFMSVPRVQDRVMGAVQIDETAQLRVTSWKNALEVAHDYPITGIGYNTYRYVQVDYGFQRDAAEHSAGGSDSSLLTLLVTTGPLGLAAYLWIIWAMASIAWNARREGSDAFERGLGLGALAALVSVVAHSLFINSLLFPHMMETMALVFGVLIALRTRRRVSP